MSWQSDKVSFARILSQLAQSKSFDDVIGVLIRYDMEETEIRDVFSRAVDFVKMIESHQPVSEPLAIEECEVDEDNFNSVVVTMDVRDFNGGSYEDFLDRLTEKAIDGGSCMMDVTYEILDLHDKNVLIEVTGDCSILTQ